MYVAALCSDLDAAFAFVTSAAALLGAWEMSHRRLEIALFAGGLWLFMPRNCRGAASTPSDEQCRGSKSCAILLNVRFIECGDPRKSPHIGPRALRCYRRKYAGGLARAANALSG